MNKHNDLKISFLFGSGISIPAGIANVETITNSIIAGKDCKDGIEYFESGKHYLKKQNNDQFQLPDKKAVIKNITEFLSIINVEANRFFKKIGFNRKANYEDLYYLTMQFDNINNPEALNPAILQFLEFIEEKTDHLWNNSYYQNSLQYFSQRVAEYIFDVARIFLSKDPENTDYLGFLIDSVNDNEFSQLNIFTLNNDLVLENFFEKACLDFNDFMEKQEATFFKKHLNISKPIKKTNLLKLHGSFNMFDNTYYFPDQQPLVLMGTLNKIVDYSNDNWLEIQWKFKQMLEESDCLVISGYGFGDDVINNRIASWAIRNRNRKIIIIHPTPENLSDKSDKLIERGLWAEMLLYKRLIFINKWIQDVSWTEIKRHFP